MTPNNYPFTPMDIEIQKTRFLLAIADVMESGDDPRSLDTCHIFDFHDGYRLNITRDLTDEGEFIVVTGGPYKAEPLPATLIIARLGILVASITDHLYTEPEVLQIQGRIVVLAYICKSAESVS